MAQKTRDILAAVVSIAIIGVLIMMITGCVLFQPPREWVSCNDQYYAFQKVIDKPHAHITKWTPAEEAYRAEYMRQLNRLLPERTPKQEEADRRADAVFTRRWPNGELLQFVSHSTAFQDSMNLERAYIRECNKTNGMNPIYAEGSGGGGGIPFVFVAPSAGYPYRP